MADSFHATTIVSVRRNGKVVIGGDGQVTLGHTVVKSNARKLRRLGRGDVLAGFAGATADAFTLFELFEDKLATLFDHSENPAFIYEHEWRLKDLIMWDNRCTIHGRTWFPEHENRLLRRCTVEGGPLQE